MSPRTPWSLAEVHRRVTTTQWTWAFWCIISILLWLIICNAVCSKRSSNNWGLPILSNSKFCCDGHPVLQHKVKRGYTIVQYSAHYAVVWHCFYFDSSHVQVSEQLSKGVSKKRLYSSDTLCAKFRWQQRTTKHYMNRITASLRVLSAWGQLNVDRCVKAYMEIQLPWWLETGCMALKLRRARYVSFSSSIG